jgi:hypothetical protein
VLATAESDLADAQLVRLREGFAQDAERLRLQIIFGSYKIGSVKKRRRQFFGFDELLDASWSQSKCGVL